MKSIHIPVLSILFILLFSCQPNYNKEIEQVDELLDTINASEKMLHTVNKDSLFVITQTLKEDIKRLREKNDTLTREAAFKADEYVGRLKDLNRLYNNYDAMEKEIELLKTQLTNLKTDLENGLITKENFLTYYKNEKSAVVVINDKITHSTNGINQRIQKLYANHDDFVALIDNPASYKSYKAE